MAIALADEEAVTSAIFPDAEAEAPRGRSAGVKALAAYAGTLVACLLILTWTLQLWWARPGVPLVGIPDAVFHEAMIKAIIDHGWYLHNDSLGAPWGQDMHDFPMADTLHFFLEKLLAGIVPEPGLIFNAYLLLTFPLAAFSALFVLRRFGIAYPVAMLASLLYTFLPYHFLHMAHLHLAGYYLVPFTVLMALRIYTGQLPPPRHRPGLVGWLLPRRQMMGAIVVCVLTGLSGGYYAFFTCFLLGVAGLAAAWRRRRLAPLASAAGLAAIVMATFGASLWPTTRYRWENGPNLAAEDSRRRPYEAEIYGLKLTQLVLPITGHRLTWAANLKQDYNSAPWPLINENDSASLGLLGGAAFLFLLSCLLPWRRAARHDPLLEAPAVLTGASLLLATVGGFGSLFALLVSPTLRCYNRISIYVGFLALFALAVVLDRGLRRCAITRGRAIGCWCFLGGLLIFGVYDQTSANYVPAYKELREQHLSMRSFVRQIEAIVPAGSSIYQLPYVSFPANGCVHLMGDYDHLRPYLYSRGLHWSYGAMRGRDGDTWHRQLAEKPPAEMLETLALAGFDGIYLDRAGFADGSEATESELTTLLAVRPLVSDDGRLAFFPLAHYTAELRQRTSEEQWNSLRERRLHPVLCTWGGGFSPVERHGEESWRWCSAVGQLVVTNRGTSPRKVHVRMNCQTPGARPCHLHVAGDLLNLDGPIDSHGTLIETSLVVSPGCQGITFHCDGPPLASAEGRPLVFRVVNFEVREED